MIGGFFGVVADDFTGASDAASFLVASGVSTVLFNGIPSELPELRKETEAIVIALKSRTEPVEQAVLESLDAFEWLKKVNARKFYFKYCSTFDSTDAGNIGPVTDAVLEKYNIPYTLLCPSLPINGRTVRDGKLYVYGVPLAESHMKNHPLTPMRKSKISELMAIQGKYSCIDISSADLTDNCIMHKIEQRLSMSGDDHCYVVPDYWNDAQGDLIAERFWDIPFLTGGSGLIGALGKRFVKISNNKIIDGEAYASCGISERRDTPAVLMAGSCSVATLKQIDAFKKSGAPCLKIEADKLYSGEQTVDTIWNWIENCQESALLYSSSSDDDIRLNQTKYGTQVADLIEGTFSSLAVRALQAGYGRFIVAGGETSGAVMKALGFETFYIGSNVAPGVPVMIPTENPSLRLVLKSGNFGQEDFFKVALEKTNK